MAKKDINDLLYRASFLCEATEDDEVEDVTPEEESEIECPDCNGTGETEDGEECETCGGTGLVSGDSEDPEDGEEPEETDGEEPEDGEEYEVDMANPVCPCCGAKLVIIDDTTEDDGDEEEIDPEDETEGEEIEVADPSIMGDDDDIYYGEDDGEVEVDMDESYVNESVDELRAKIDALPDEEFFDLIDSLNLGGTNDDEKIEELMTNLDQYADQVEEWFLQ